MLATLSSFSSLYFATLLMLIGTGLFNTYMGLRLTAPVSYTHLTLPTSDLV